VLLSSDGSSYSCVEKVPIITANWDGIFIEIESSTRQVKFGRTEASMLRWMCGFELRERKSNAWVIELLAPGASLVIKKC